MSIPACRSVYMTFAVNSPVSIFRLKNAYFRYESPRGFIDACYVHRNGELHCEVALFRSGNNYLRNAFYKRSLIATYGAVESVFVYIVIMINFFESYFFQSLFCPYVVFFYRESSAVVFTFVISDVAGNKAGRSYGVVMGAVFKVVFELG